MDRHWLTSYGTHIPTEIDPDAYGSVLEMLEGAMVRYADKPAFRCFGQTLTYADTDRLSRAFAAYLQNKLGISKGDRVAVMLPNLPAFPLAMLGIIRAGATQVNVNPLYTARELEHQLNDAGAKRFGDATRENVGKPFAIVLDNKVISAPVIREPILGGSGIISGSFTVQSASDLALLLLELGDPGPTLDQARAELVYVVGDGVLEIEQLADVRKGKAQPLPAHADAFLVATRDRRRRPCRRRHRARAGASPTSTSRRTPP